MENKQNLRVINLNFSTPQPIIRNGRNKDWIMWGRDNLYPQFLVDQFHNKSITHKQIINRKVKMIAGNGFDLPTNPSPKLLQFLANVNGELSMEKIAMKMAFDLEIFNGITLNPVWDITGDNINTVKYVPFERHRQDRYNYEGDGLPLYAWISNDWCDKYVRHTEPQKFLQFNTKWTKKKSQRSQIMIRTTLDQGFSWYPSVEYSPAMNAIDADFEILNYYNSSIKNGFQAGFLLNFGTGIPTEEEMDRMYEEIALRFTGSGNANKFLLGWSNGASNAPTLTAIPANDSDTKYIQLIDTIRDKIFEAHQVTNPQLFGIMVPGQLGGRTELLQALAEFQSTYIDVKQRFIEEILNELAGYAGVDIMNEPIKLKKYVIDIPNIAGTPVLTMADLISLQQNVKTAQVDMNTAINILVNLYQLEIEKAKELLNVPVNTNPIIK